MSAFSDLLAKSKPTLWELAMDLARHFESAGGRMLLVGGTVRDLLLGQIPNELDIEVQKLSAEEIKSSLQHIHSCDEVGKSFGVLRLKGKPVEIALPRTEVKSIS